MRVAVGEHGLSRPVALTVVAAAALQFISSPVLAQATVSSLVGSWGGSGRITYTDGSSEGIRCTAYYSGGASELRMAIQCRSDRNPIHIRSTLRISGSRASGGWEERTFNASGTASGNVGANSLSLSISGGGFSGSMSVAFGKSSQNVSITTQGIAMSRATMSFTRQ